MSVPASRDQFKSYCLRKLGNEVIRINVSDNQVEDRIDEALLFWQDFNSDGTFQALLQYVVQTADITNQYITLPDNVIGAVSIFDTGGAMNAMDIFDIRYQIALNDLYTLTSVSMIPYYMAFQQIELLEQILVGLKPVRFEKYANRLYIDMDWGNVVPGQYLIIRCYQIVDPDTYPSIWGDRPLQNLAAAYIKKQWAENLGKLSFPMPGNVTINGEKLMREAELDIEKAERQIREVYEFPPIMEIG